jgi:hypothetical protein
MSDRRFKSLVKRLRERVDQVIRERELDEPDQSFYGGDGTWHQTGTVDVQLDEDGNVVAVWFRCRTLPFKQSTHIFPAGYGPLQGEGSIKGIVFEGDE